MARSFLTLSAGVAAACLWSGAASAATPCADLAKIGLKDVTIETAQLVDAPAAVLAALPKTSPSGPFCRVAGFIAPRKDARIGFEVWLPAAAKWNRKLNAVGNGGFAGALNHRAMVAGLNRGYVTMTTDLGHINQPAGATEDATWALGHPDKVVDYAYRAQHLTTLAAKDLIKAHYDATPAHSYFTGCSAGGIRGLQSVFRFPSDYDGYVVGNATPDHFGQEIGAMWNTMHGSLLREADALTAADAALVHKAVLQQCAGKDGGLATDLFLTDPRKCKVDLAPLRCAAAKDATCLTATQIAIVDKVYRGPVNPRTGASLYSGLTPGTELGWERYFLGRKNPAKPDRPWAGFMESIAYGDPAYLSGQKYLPFDFDRDEAALRAKVVGGEPLGASWNARNRNLEAFRAAGGKMIQYHGWDDPNIPALEAIRVFEEVVGDQAKRHRLSKSAAEDRTRQFYRLFMAAGLGHCAGGDGPSNFGQGQGAGDTAERNTLIALEQWVERGVAPERFIGTKADPKTEAVEMTRPVCVYPRIPVWKGSGSTTDAASFSCSAPPARSARGTPKPVKEAAR